MQGTPQDVLITGMGVVSPIGLSVAELRESLLQNRSGIRLWQSPQMSRTLPAGVIEQDFSSQFSKLELAYMDRCSQIAMIAAGRPSRMQVSSSSKATPSVPGCTTVRSPAGEERTRLGAPVHVDKVAGSKPYTIMASMLNAAPALISTSTGSSVRSSPTATRVPLRVGPSAKPIWRFARAVWMWPWSAAPKRR